MNSIQTQAIISPTGELTIKLPPEIVSGRPVVVFIICPPIDSQEVEIVPTQAGTPHPDWSQEYLQQVLGGWLGTPPSRPEPLPWKERQLW